ncbi:MAG: hypothetical protein SF028_09705 [Candidatus Sumerlaeia bacterium]|nr:hypothetical protein [Candidatus Sumerlaeia bacterium]
MSQPEAQAPPAARTASLAALPAILALATALIWWRVPMERGVWFDDLFTMRAALVPWEGFEGAMRYEIMTPLYHMVLRGYFAVLAALGVETSVFAARLLGLALHLGAVSVLWFLLRRAFGARLGGLMTLLFAVSQQSLDTLLNVRGYALGVPAMAVATGCWMAALLAEPLADAAAERSRQKRLWTAYGLLAAVALWCHPISGAILALLAAGWFALAWPERARRPGALPFAFAAQALAAGSALPWVAWESLNALRRAAALAGDWRWDPSAGGVIQTLFEYYIYGQMPREDFTGGLYYALGVAVFALPAGAAAVAAFERRSGPPPGRAAAGFAFLCAAALANASILALVDALGIAGTYHPPRYPVFASPAWLFGIAGLAHWAAKRAGARLPWEYLVALLLLAAAPDANNRRDHVPSKIGIATWSEGKPGLFPPPGAPLFLRDTEMAKMLPRFYARWEPRPIAALSGLPDSEVDATILQLDTFRERERDIEAFFFLLRRGVFAESLEKHEANECAYRLRGVRHERLRGWFAEPRAWWPKSPVPASAVSRAMPHDMLARRGWAVPAVEEDSTVRVWTSSTLVSIPFDTPLPPGRWVAGIRGERWARPEPATEVLVRVYLGEGVTEQRMMLPEGDFLIPLPLEVAGEPVELRVEVAHALWRDGDKPREDGTWQGFGWLFHGAWVSPAPEPPPVP